MALSNEAIEVDPWVPEDTFGARLAQVRQHLRWNTKRAAETCGINDQSWRNWEAGSLPRDVYATARQIAEATGCSERWLIMGDQNLKDVTGADLRLVHSTGRDGTRPGPGQQALPFHLQLVKA